MVPVMVVKFWLVLGKHVNETCELCDTTRQKWETASYGINDKYFSSSTLFDFSIEILSYFSLFPLFLSVIENVSMSNMVRIINEFVLKTDRWW